MADLEQRVDELEKRFRELEKNMNESLSEIKVSLAEILATLKNSNNSGDLKNELIEKDVKANTEKIKVVSERTGKLEDSNKWLVRLILGSIIGLVLEAVAFYIRTRP